MQIMAEGDVEQETSAVICGVRILAVNVWEATFVHACKCEENSRVRAFDGFVSGFDSLKWNT